MDPQAPRYFIDDWPNEEYGRSRKGGIEDKRPRSKVFGRRRQDSHVIIGCSALPDPAQPPSTCGAACYYCQYCDPAPIGAQSSSAYRLCSLHPGAVRLYTPYGQDSHLCERGVSNPKTRPKRNTLKFHIAQCDFQSPHEFSSSAVDVDECFL